MIRSNDGNPVIIQARCLTCDHTETIETLAGLYTFRTGDHAAHVLRLLMIEQLALALEVAS